MIPFNEMLCCTPQLWMWEESKGLSSLDVSSSLKSMYSMSCFYKRYQNQVPWRWTGKHLQIFHRKPSKLSSLCWVQNSIPTRLSTNFPQCKLLGFCLGWGCQMKIGKKIPVWIELTCIQTVWINWVIGFDSSNVARRTQTSIFKKGNLKRITFEGDVWRHRSSIA